MRLVDPRQAYPSVSETDDFLVYRVRSSQPGTAPWRVDKQKFLGFGACNCPDFCLSKRITLKGGKQATKMQALQLGAIHGDNLACKHIKQVNGYLLMKVINGVLLKRSQAANANRQKAKKIRTMGRRIFGPTQAAPNQVWHDEDGNPF